MSIANIIYIIMAIAVAVGLFFWGRLIRYGINFNKNAKNLTDNEEFAHSVEQFFLAGNSDGSAIFASKLLNNQLDSFRKSLQKDIVSDEPIAVADIEEFFNGDILDEFSGERVCEIIPGVLTGLGLLGTFLGLAMGLKGIDTSTVAQISAGIDGLLGGMSTAFETSIVGVFASLCFSLFYKGLYSWTIRKLDNFVTAFKETQQKEIKELPINKLLGYQHKQTEMMQTFAKEVSVSISNSLSDMLMPVFAQMSESINAFADFTTSQQQESLEKIVSKFVDAMDSSLGRQFDELSKTIDMVCEWQKKSLEEMQRVVDGINATAEDVERINEISKQTAEELNKYVNGLNEISAELHKEIEAVQAQVAVSAETCDKQQEYIAELVSYEERIAALADNVSVQAEAAGKAVELLSENCKLQINNISEAAKQDMVILADTTKILAESSHQQIEALSGAAQEEMELLAETSAQLAAESSQQLKALTDAASKQMDIISDTASNVSQNSQIQMQSVLATAQTQSDAMIQATNDYVAFVQEQQSQLIKAIRDEISGMSSFAAQTSNGIIKVADSMEQSALLLDNSMNSALQRTFDTFDSGLAEITAHLSGTIADVRDTTENVPYLIRQSQNEYEKILARLTAQTEQYTKVMQQLVSKMQNIDGGKVQ